MFLRYMYFGKLPKDKPEENEAEMRYDAFFCFRFVFQGGMHTNEKFHVKLITIGFNGLYGRR